MLNVLAPETKRQLRAARFNVIVRNYYLILGATVLLLAGVFTVGLAVTRAQKNQADADLAAAQQEATQYAATSKAADEFSKNLAIDKTILASDVRFNKLITDIAALVPGCVILSNLSIGTTTLTTPLAISGRSCTYDDGLRLKNSLEESPLFENVKIVSATASDPASLVGNPLFAKYSIVLSLSAQFSRAQTTTTSTKGATQ